MLETKSINLGMDYSVSILSSEKYYRKAHSIGASLLPGFIWALDQKKSPTSPFLSREKSIFNPVTKISIPIVPHLCQPLGRITWHFLPVSCS